MSGLITCQVLSASQILTHITLMTLDEMRTISVIFILQSRKLRHRGLSNLNEVTSAVCFRIRIGTQVV